MKCPYCNHTFALTWQRYFTSPMGRHTCPSCTKLSQIKRSFLQLSLTAVICWGFAIPFGIFFYHWLGGFWTILGILLGSLIGMPCDKILDEKFRGLEPIKKYDDA